MFILRGQVVAKLTKKIKNGDNAGKEYPVYQVMIGSDSRKQILDVSDFNNYSINVGESAEIPCRIKPFVFRNGAPGLDIMTLRTD
jgi:hypothetical protein